MDESERHIDREKESRYAHDLLERYSGSAANDFQPRLLLTNFSRYIEYFAHQRKLKIHQGSMFQVAHDKERLTTMLDFKIGSPAAALVVDVCSYLPIQVALLLGMCGGLRRRYRVGDYFVPVASIRAEGTSDFYFPPEVPALANFLIQRAVTQVLDQQKVPYHIGTTYTTNSRFWEFNEGFKHKLKTTKAQAIEMECATLFTGSYKRHLTLGALLLISDLPLDGEGIKTREKAQKVFELHADAHVEKGIIALESAHNMRLSHIAGGYPIKAPKSR